MRNLDGSKSWDFRIGETKIFDTKNDISYTLVVGYIDQPNQSNTTLYVRVYDQNDDLIVGTWFYDFFKGGAKYFSSNIVEQCIKCARRMEKLTVFA
jgi:hypothetical protein